MPGPPHAEKRPVVYSRLLAPGTLPQGLNDLAPLPRRLPRHGSRPTPAIVAAPGTAVQLNSPMEVDSQIHSGWPSSSPSPAPLPPQPLSPSPPPPPSSCSHGPSTPRPSRQALLPSSPLSPSSPMSLARMASHARPPVRDWQAAAAVVARADPGAAGRRQMRPSRDVDAMSRRAALGVKRRE
jgi:hypothetical protein